MNRIEQLLAELCPEGVEFRELGEIGNICMCKRIMKEETSAQGEIPFYKIGTFGAVADAFISKKKYESYRNKYPFPKKGDVLVSAAGTIGRTVIYDGEPAYFQDSNIVWIDNNESIILNSFLYHLYKIIRWDTDGGTIKRLYNHNIRKVLIPAPPVVIQQEIVNILDKFAELQAQLQTELQKRKIQYDYYRNALLTFPQTANDAAFPWLRKLLDKYCPQGVEFRTLGALCDFQRGISITKKDIVQGNVPVVAGGQKPAYFHNVSNRTENTIVIASSGSAGFVSYWQEPIFVSDAFSVKTNPDLLLDKYCFYWLKNIQLDLYRLQRGGGVSHVYAQDVGLFKIPVPPLSVQQKIVAILDQFDALVNNLNYGLPAEIKMRKTQYEYYRNQLLTFKEKQLVPV